MFSKISDNPTHKNFPSIHSQNTKSKNKKTSKIQSKQEQNFFSVQKKKNEDLEVKLNRVYQLKPGENYYDTIEFLLPLINQKNNIDKSHIKEKFDLSYFSSLEFELAKDNMQEEKCMICLQQFEIRQIEQELAKQTQLDIYMLPCSHKYHMGCLNDLIGEKDWAKCPICSTIFGQMKGDQPDGKMTVNFSNIMTLPGHSKGVITIYYHMQGGVRNGVHYAGTSRTAYLPDNKEGQEVLQLLQEAFRRKLIFTVGRSVTTGLDNQTVWNGIHHKTSTSGGASHFGYPDPTYLARVKEELAAKGVTLESLKKHHHHCD